MTIRTLERFRIHQSVCESSSLSYPSYSRPRAVCNHLQGRLSLSHKLITHFIWLLNCRDCKRYICVSVCVFCEEGFSFFRFQALKPLVYIYVVCWVIHERYNLYLTNYRWKEKRYQRTIDTPIYITSYVQPHNQWKTIHLYEKSGDLIPAPRHEVVA